MQKVMHSYCTDDPEHDVREEWPIQYHGFLQFVFVQCRDLDIRVGAVVSSLRVRSLFV